MSGPVRRKALIHDLAIVLRGALGPHAHVGLETNVAAQRIRDVLGFTDGELTAGIEKRIRATLDGDMERDPMFHQAYMEVQGVLDKALGTGEEDGAGAGIAADVWLLMEQRDAARAEAAKLAAQLEEMAKEQRR